MGPGNEALSRYHVAFVKMQMGVVASMASRCVYMVRMPPKLREVGGNNAMPDADPQTCSNKWILEAPSEQSLRAEKEHSFQC